MAKRVLVIGATGLLREPVARRLREAGFAVRVMARDGSRARAMFSGPFEIVSGDALEVADVDKALVGCDAVHLSIDHDREDECVTQVLQAVRGRDLRRFSYISGITVCEENRWFPLVDRKLCAEQAIHASGIDLHSMSYWILRLIARLTSNARMRMGIEMVSYLERVGNRGDSAEANALLAAAQTTLAQWLLAKKRDVAVLAA